MILKDSITRGEADRLAETFVSRANVTDAVFARIVETAPGTAPTVRSNLGRSVFNGELADEVKSAETTACPLTFIQGKNDKFIQVDYYGKLI